MGERKGKRSNEDGERREQEVHSSLLHSVRTSSRSWECSSLVGETLGSVPSSAWSYMPVIPALAKQR